VSLIGSDGELTMVSKIEQADIVTPGSTLLPSKIHDIVRLCSDGDVSISAVKGFISVKSGEASWDIRGEVDEYPEIPEPEGEEITIPKTALLEGLNRCKPAIDSHNIRAMFAYIQVKDGRMRATDGNKFHQVDFASEANILMSSRLVVELVRRLRSMALDEVIFSESDQNYFFKCDSDTIISTRTTVEYPDVDAVMLAPALKNNEQIVIDRVKFVSAIKRVALTADEDTNYLSLELDGHIMNLTSLDKYGNTSREKIDVVWDGDARTIGVNHNHLLDIMTGVKSGQVTIMVGQDEGNKPTSLCFRDNHFVGVLLQLRTDLVAAMQGSTRVRPAQIAPVGWGDNSVEASDADTTSRRRSIRDRIDVDEVDDLSVVLEVSGDC